MTFSEKLLKLRKEKGMSQESLAEQLNTSRQAISKWENGKGFPETEKLLLIGNVFDVSIDYLLKENPEPSDSENEQGFYASREFVAGYIISNAKKAKMLAIGLFITIVSTMIPNLFPEQETFANIAMLILITVGISLLMIFAFQSFFSTDKYKVMEDQPLVFDNNFLKEFKENYKILMKKYIGMIVLSLVLIFGGIIFANLFSGNLIDSAFLLLVSIAVYIMVYAIYMMIIYNSIVNSDKRVKKSAK